MQEGKVVVWENFIIAKERSEGQGRKEIQLKVNFQIIERRDKKAFLSEQCKEIEENKIMGKARDLFKKIGEIQGTFHAMVGTRKGRNVRT